MSKKGGQLWKYPLPDDWTPTGYWCFTCVVPADQQYVDIVTGALGALTQPKPFQPDVTGQGPAAVALAFEKALYLMPFILSETCGPMTQPPIPDEAAAADAAAAWITVFMQYLVTTINGCASVPGDCSGCVDSIMVDLTPYGANDAVRGALSRLCADLTAAPGTRGDYETDCVYMAQFNDFKQHIADNPYDWLNHAADWIFNWLNQTADGILQDLATVAGLMGFGVQGFINDHGGIPSGGGADFGSTCPWEITFLPGDGMDLWTVGGYPSAGSYGVLTGLGWQGQIVDPPDQDNLRTTLLSPDIPANFRTTLIELDVYGTCSGGNLPYASADPTASGGFPYSDYGVNSTVTTITFTFAAVDTRNVGVYLNCLLFTENSNISRIKLAGVQV